MKCGRVRVRGGSWGCGRWRGPELGRQAASCSGPGHRPGSPPWEASAAACPNPAVWTGEAAATRGKRCQVPGWTYREGRGGLRLQVPSPSGAHYLCFQIVPTDARLFFFFWEFCVGSARADRGTPGARGRSRGTRAWRDGSGTYIFPFYPSRASVRSQDRGPRPRQPHP